jgi:hypothetical protein
MTNYIDLSGLLWSVLPFARKFPCKRKFWYLQKLAEQLGNLLRMRQVSIELVDFPEEITKCSWLLYIFECLFINLYNFFAGDKVKCTLRFQCMEYLVYVVFEHQ